MDDASGWLTKHVVVLTAHCDAKRPRCTPDKLGWLFLFVIREFAQESMLVFVSLQGLTTLVSQQKATLLGLIDTYCRSIVGDERATSRGLIVEHQPRGS